MPHIAKINRLANIRIKIGVLFLGAHNVLFSKELSKTIAFPKVVFTRAFTVP